MNKAFVDLLVQREADIKRVLDEVEKFKVGLRERVETLGTMINYEDKDVPVRQWYYRENGQFLDVLVHDVQREEDFVVGLDARVRPEGWHISVFPRKRKNMEKLNALLSARGIRCTEEEGRKVTARFAFDVDLTAVQEHVQGVLDQLAQQ